MTEIIGNLGELILNSLANLGAQFASFAPKIAGMFTILLIGWIIARIAQAATAKLLVRAKLDQAGGYLGLNEILEEAGIQRPLSGLISRLLYWLVLLTFVLPAAETLGLTSVATATNLLIAFLPNVIASLLILMLGLLLARFIGNAVSSGAAASEVPYSHTLGLAARGSMIAVVSIVAVEQLGVKSSLLQWSLIAVLAAVLFSIAFSFAVGSRDVVSAILAGYYLRKSIREGATVEVLGRRGTLARIGPVDTLFRSEDRDWSVPNSQLLNAVVEREPPVREGAGAQAD